MPASGDVKLQAFSYSGVQLGVEEHTLTLKNEYKMGKMRIYSLSHKSPLMMVEG
jgi:hypothetical protein